MFQTVHKSLTQWITGVFISAVRAVSRPQDRSDVLQWLSSARAVIAADNNRTQKFTSLYRSLDSRRVVAVSLNSVIEGVRNYSKAKIPLAAKAAVPITLLAMPFVAGQGAGLAAFGTAIGLPVLLLIFIGSAGITSIIEACATSETARAFTQAVLKRVQLDEEFRAFRAAMRQGTQGDPETPSRKDMPDNTTALMQRLQTMDEYEFEQHVMSFFETPAFSDVSVTRRSGDRGIDGFASHARGLIVVQCKRYGPLNRVGGPEIRQFKGAMQEHDAFRGYFITSSAFTYEAALSASKSHNLLLVDIDTLLKWHQNAPLFNDLNSGPGSETPET